MRNFLPVATLVFLAAAGCKPKPEEQIPGTWTGPNDTSVTFTKEKSWNQDVKVGTMNLKVAGTWTVSGRTLTITPNTVNDRPIAQVAKQGADMLRRMGRPKAEIDQIADWAKADEFTLSDDGKTLTKNNPKKGQETTLTKKEG